MTSTEAQPDIEQGRRLQPFASFRYRGYPWLWAANVCHGAVQGAQGFLIIWLVIETLGRDYPGALFTVMLLLPGLVLGLPAGWFADRGDRRLLLMASHLAVSLALLLTAILTTAGVLSLELVMLMTLLGVAGLAVGQPVRFALIPALVPRERILNGNALSELGMGLGAVGGIPLTALAIDTWPVESSFVILAVVSAMGALLLFPLRAPDREPPRDSDAHPETSRAPLTMPGDFAEGFRFLWANAELRLLFLVLLAAALLAPWLVLDFAELQHRLGVSVRAVAFLSLFVGVGAILSTVTLAFVRRVRRAGAWYGMVIIGSALAALGAWFSTSYGLTGLLMGLYGLGLGLRGLLFLTLVQSHTPIAVMGRVMGIFVALTAGVGLLTPLVTRGGQALLEDDGWIVFSVIVLVGVVALVLAWSPGLRRMPSHPEPAEPEDETATAAPGAG